MFYSPCIVNSCFSQKDDEMVPTESELLGRIYDRFKIHFTHGKYHRVDMKYETSVAF
jgi:hypothetical protein